MSDTEKVDDIAIGVSDKSTSNSGAPLESSRTIHHPSPPPHRDRASPQRRVGDVHSGGTRPQLAQVRLRFFQRASCRRYVPGSA